MDFGHPACRFGSMVGLDGIDSPGFGIFEASEPIDSVIRAQYPWRCVAPNRIAEQRAVLSRYPAIALELLPQLLPVPGHTPGHDEGQPAGLPGHTGCGAQQPLPEAARTPALTGGLLHDAATGMQHLVGQQMHQQEGFVVAVDPGGRQRRGTIRITPWARAGRQRWIEHILQFAEVSFGLAALAILRQQVLTGTAALGDVGYQPEVMQEQLTGLLEHHQHDPPGSIPTAGLVAMFMAPDTRLLGRSAGRALEMGCRHRIEYGVVADPGHILDP